MKRLLQSVLWRGPFSDLAITVRHCNLMTLLTPCSYSVTPRHWKVELENRRVAESSCNVKYLRIRKYLRFSLWVCWNGEKYLEIWLGRHAAPRWGGSLDELGPVEEACARRVARRGFRRAAACFGRLRGSAFFKKNLPPRFFCIISLLKVSFSFPGFFVKRAQCQVFRTWPLEASRLSGRSVRAWPAYTPKAFWFGGRWLKGWDPLAIFRNESFCFPGFVFEGLEVAQALEVWVPYLIVFHLFKNHISRQIVLHRCVGGFVAFILCLLLISPWFHCFKQIGSQTNRANQLSGL